MIAKSFLHEFWQGIIKNLRYVIYVSFKKSGWQPAFQQNYKDYNLFGWRFGIRRIFFNNFSNLIISTQTLKLNFSYKPTFENEIHAISANSSTQLDVPKRSIRFSYLYFLSLSIYFLKSTDFAWSLFLKFGF